MVIQIAGITGNPDMHINKRALVPMCADNGVVEEGVTQTGQEVTAIVAENFLSGDTSACMMCRQCGTKVIPVDIGMAVDTKVATDLKVACGTANMTKGPAMTREQAVQALEAGIEMVRRLKEDGYGLLATGEMGIGNTTTSSAVASVLLNRPVEEEDAERFQSIFAKKEGAVTAPTASLHFSRELMKRLEIKGIDFAYITLHAGLGNFRDIDVEDLTKHKMDSEQMLVDEAAVKTVNRAKDTGRNVCAVGTTVMRAIESAVSTDGHLKEFEGWTNKFIFPPYEFTVANSMISNFHMPLSTLLMIVAAFGGYEQVMDAYHVALKEGYRFGTYGDAMLILDK